MAIDTRTKRASAVAPALPWRGGLLPASDGTIGGGDRRSVLGLYSGVFRFVESLEQVVLAVSEETDVQHYIEGTLEQVVLGVIEQTDAQHYIEPEREQVILIVLEETDLQTYLENPEQVILAILEETDELHAVFPGTSLYVEVYDAAGNLVGPGPIFQVQEAQITERLNRIGEFEFVISAADERAALLGQQGQVRYVRIYREGEGLIHAGIVEAVEVEAS